MKIYEFPQWKWDHIIMTSYTVKQVIGKTHPSLRNQTMILKQVSQRLLADRTYDIEFNGYLSNHAKHAIVALDRLEAPDVRIQEYWDQYTLSTPYGISLHKLETPWDSAEPASAEDWETWRGKKVGWQEMVKFLDEQNKNSNDLVTEYAPDLLGGIAGALTHGIIHLGWGVDAESPWMIQEGLAYLNFCYLPASPVQSRAIQEPDGLTSLLRIAKEYHVLNLQETWVEAAKSKYDETFHPELVETGFQWQLAKVLKEAHPIATSIPSWIHDKPLDQVYEELYRLVGLLYLSTRSPDGNGNFVVLHLFTSLWGLQKVCDLIDEESITRNSLEVFWEAAVCAISSQSSGFPTVEVLQAANDKFPRDTVDAIGFDWSNIVERGCAEEEEHNIKLVYVAKELWRKYGRWVGFSEAAMSFTVTPNVSRGTSSFSA